MRAPFTRLFVHCVWATWDRLPLLDPDLERRVYSALVGKVRELGCAMHAVGGTPDHVHLLVRMPTTLPVAHLVKELKGASSHLVTHALRPVAFFKWQGGYGAFTVSVDQVQRVRDYVQHQKRHHATGNVRVDWERTTEEPDQAMPGE